MQILFGSGGLWEAAGEADLLKRAARSVMAARSSAALPADLDSDCPSVWSNSTRRIQAASAQPIRAEHGWVTAKKQSKKYLSLSSLSLPGISTSTPITTFQTSCGLYLFDRMNHFSAEFKLIPDSDIGVKDQTSRVTDEA